ncbi:hypothetical protein CHLRE_13g588900v5 [Chlamydomonas reinhardtii]|uniref:3'-5' exonuclease n=1 Tax=Chlamydomonas reinhardtii TaxID=3055 RepID=A0A2K3D0Y9_CHLRE|nr:uncharacterized protein CHLRE_13g588900v5 [Chlamydomonas reinhardtii]PNW74192.1 hypothetical protein CHLRE_13g588900v5 [Chlamydomonas reinhardtii]
MSEPEELTAEEYTALERALEEAEKRAAFVAKPLADQTNAPQFGGGGGAVRAALPLGLGTSVPHPFKPTSAVATTDERVLTLSDSGRATCSVSGAAVGGAAGSVGSPTAPPAKRPNTAQQVPHWSSLGSGVAGGRPHASLTSVGSHMQTAVQPPTVSGWGGNHAAGVHGSPWPHPQQQHHIQQLPSHPYQHQHQHQHQHQQGGVQGAHHPSGGNLYPSLHAAAYHLQQPQPACTVLAGSAAAGPRPDTSPLQAPSSGDAAVAAAAAALGMQPFLGAAAAGSVATERLQPLGTAVPAASVPSHAWPGWPSGSGSGIAAHTHVPTPQHPNQQQQQQQQRISMGAPSGAPVCAPVASSCAAQSQRPCQHNQSQQPHTGPRSHQPHPQTAPHRVGMASTTSRGSGAPPLPATSPQTALLLVPPPPAAALAWVSRPPGVAQLQAASGAATSGGGAFVPAVEPAAAPDRRPPSPGLQQQPQQPGPLQPVAQSAPGPEPGPLGQPHPHTAASLLISAQGSRGCCTGPSFVVAATPLPPPLPLCGTVVAPPVPEAAPAAPPQQQPAACSAAIGTWPPQLPRSLHRPPLQATGVLDGAAGVGACAGGSSTNSSSKSAMTSRDGEAGRGGAGGSTAGCSATVALGIAPAALCEAAAVAAPAIAANGSTADNNVNGAKPASSRRLPASFLATTAPLPAAASSLLGSAKDSPTSGGSSTTACVAGAQSSSSGGNVSISRAGSSRAAAAALPSIAEVRAAKAAAVAAATGGAAAGGAVSRPRLPVLPYQGAIRYATTALEVEWLVGQLAAAAPAVVGLDMEWKPQYVAGVPANPVALLQICYAVAPAAAAAPQQPVPAATAAAAALPAVPALPAAAVPQSSSASATAPAAAGNGAADEQRVPAGSEATAAAGAAAGAVGAGGGAAGSSATAAAMGQSGVQEQRALHPSFEGRHCVCLLLHVLHSGIPPRLRHLLEAEQPVKVGVNISGDASKLRRDCGVEMRGLLELDEVANDRVLQVIENITVNTEYRSRWSLSALVETALRCHLPKPNNIRCGNWERKPLDGAQRRYAALDAYAGLAVWAALVRLPRRHIIAAAPSAAARQLPAAPSLAAAAAGAAVAAAHGAAAVESAAAAHSPASAATVAVEAAAVGTAAAAASAPSSDV